MRAEDLFCSSVGKGPSLKPGGRRGEIRLSSLLALKGSKWRTQQSSRYIFFQVCTKPDKLCSYQSRNDHPPRGELPSGSCEIPKGASPKASVRYLRGQDPLLSKKFQWNLSGAAMFLLLLFKTVCSTRVQNGVFTRGSKPRDSKRSHQEARNGHPKRFKTKRFKTKRFKTACLQNFLMPVPHHGPPCQAPFKPNEQKLHGAREGY